MDNLRFNVDRFHGRVGSACNMVQMKPNNFYTKTGNLWYNPTNIPVNSENNPIQKRKEIKSAYSYNRPDYQLVQLKIEKKIMESKNIELREKRNQEEIKKFMDEAAMAKAKFNEKREIKFNIDNIVKEYEKTFKIDKDANKLIEEQKEKELNNEELKIKEFKNINQSYLKTICATQPKVSNLSINDNLNDNKNNIGLNTEGTIRQSNNVEFNKISSKFPNCFSNVNNKIVYSKIENKSVLLNRKEVENSNENKEDLSELDNKKNIKDIKADNTENNYKLSLQINKSELFDKLKKDQDKSLKIKYDTVAFNMVNDRILKTRIQSAKICDVKEIAPKKMDYVQYYMPLSAFDELNYKTYTEKFNKPKKKYNRPKTASEFALRNYKHYENNYLLLRKEMTKFYGQEMESMNKMLYEKIDQPISEKDKDKDKDKEKKDEKQSKKVLPPVGKGKSTGRVMSAFVNVKRDGLLINNTFEQMFDRPLEGPPKPMFFLPKQELSLLNKPPGMKAKKKKKGKKKKKY